MTIILQNQEGSAFAEEISYQKIGFKTPSFQDGFNLINSANLAHIYVKCRNDPESLQVPILSHS